MLRVTCTIAALACGLPGLAVAQPSAAPQALMSKECGACHMAFPANQLPARSWAAVMAGLADHFGENAALDPASRAAIEGYLTANAATGRAKALRGLAENQTPLRITELPSWQREHRGKVTPQKLAITKAKSQSDCVACHAGAARGQFDDD